MSATSSPVLIIGASRGLGLALTKYYSNTPRTVYATVRSPPKPGTLPSDVRVIEGIDVGEEDAGTKIVQALKGDKVGLVVVVSGVLNPETFDEPKWKEEIQMYTICAIAPVFLIQHLYKSGSIVAAGDDRGKVIIVTSEAGSVALRTEKEGGGMYGHHGSKAAANMIGRLLSFDLKPSGISVAMIHPGFLRTDMTQRAGFEQFYESGRAISPEDACPGIAKFIDNLDISETGKFWAPNGARDIGGAEEVMGEEVLELPGPIYLPW